MCEKMNGLISNRIKFRFATHSDDMNRTHNECIQYNVGNVEQLTEFYETRATITVLDVWEEMEL